MSQASRVMVVANAEYAEPLRSAGTLDTLGGLDILPLAADAEIAPDLLYGTSLLVVEVTPDNPTSLKRLTHIRQNNPELLVLAAIHDANLSLVRSLLREGVADVVPLPFDATELLPVVLDALARTKDSVDENIALAPVIAVARSSGGCGATTIATHLAAELGSRRSTGRGAVILDLDLQFGSVADYLGATSAVGIENLLAAGDRLDDQLIRSVAIEAAPGVSVIAAPEAIIPLESVDADQLMHVIDYLRRDFSYVVLDLPADWTNWTLSAAISADVILLVVELSVTSLRQAKRRLDLFRSVGVSRHLAQIVVNMVEKRLFRTIDLSDVTETLSAPVIGSISAEKPLVDNAQMQGQLVSQVQRKSRFLSDIAKIADELEHGPLSGSSIRKP